MGAVVPQRRQKRIEFRAKDGKTLRKFKSEKGSRFSRGVWLRWSSRGDTKRKKKVEKLGKTLRKLKREVGIVGVCGGGGPPPLPVVSHRSSRTHTRPRDTFGQISHAFLSKFGQILI